MYVYMYLCSYRNLQMYMYLCKYRNTVADWAMLTLDSHNYCRAPPRHATIWSLGAGHQVEVHSLFDFLCFKFPYYCPVEIYYQYQYHLIPRSWTPSGSALCFHLFSIFICLIFPNILPPPIFFTSFQLSYLQAFNDLHVHIYVTTLSVGCTLCTVHCKCWNSYKFKDWLQSAWIEIVTLLKI